jgi:hypothetical protein
MDQENELSEIAWKEMVRARRRGDLRVESIQTFGPEFYELWGELFPVPGTEFVTVQWRINPRKK